MKYFYSILVLAVMLFPNSIIAQTYDQRISMSTDDADEDNGTMKLSDGKLLISTGTFKNGLRFTGITIPSGAIITSAVIEFVADSGNSTATSTTIYGQDNTASPPTFGSTPKEISSRLISSSTSNSVTWNFGTWSSGTAYPSPDLSAIVQEIVNDQGGLSSGVIAFLFDGTTGDKREPVSYDGNTAEAPRLIMSWIAPPNCTYRDEFNSVSYSNTNGTQNWVSNPWMEFNDGANGPTGNVACFLTDYIISIPVSGDCTFTTCPNGNSCLTFETITAGIGDYISRQFDLSGATVAVLTFDYNINFFSPDAVDLEVRTGGGSWTTLATYNATSSGTAYFNLNSYIATDTEIRFIQTNAAGGIFAVDNFQIAYDCSTCSISITQSDESACMNNGTNTLPADDYFQLTFNATATGGGATNKYEVVLDANADGTTGSGTILNPGGTTYGSSVTVGTNSSPPFQADGSTTYAITIRDIDTPTCHADYTSSTVASCSPCTGTPILGSVTLVKDP